jgi:hypothetical protein
MCPECEDVQLDDDGECPECGWSPDEDSEEEEPNVQQPNPRDPWSYI